MLRSVQGTVASIGYAWGPLFILDGRRSAYAPSGNPATEAERLRSAIAAAAAQIAALMGDAEEDAAAILEFQVAMLEDESLAAPAFAEIEDGRDAQATWSDALTAQVAEYEAAGDAYFRARSADLRDIRERVIRALSGAAEQSIPAGAVLYASDLTPTRFLAADWSQGGGIVLAAGSAASHVAMLARARGVPMLVGIGTLAAAQGDAVLLDAEHGQATLRANGIETVVFEQARDAWRVRVALADAGIGRPAVTLDGVPVAVMVNIAAPRDVEDIDIGTCDGIGLMRTEFLFNDGLPDEETQLFAYRRVLEWAGDKPVTIRTVDAGGDKPVAGFTVSETNPFLGLRGIRLSLSRPEVFRTQIRALLRAGAYGNLKVMLPMVTLDTELAAAKALFAEEAAALALPMPPLGIMVEVPAVAIAPELFPETAFFSVGSNDLTQYVMAAARDNGAVAALNDPTHPSVLRLIGNAVRGAEDLGVPISICGDAASDPQAIPALLKLGLRTLSVAPAQLALVKARAREVDVDG